MGDSVFSIDPDDLAARFGKPEAPLVFDVRKRAAFDQDSDVLPSAAWRDYQTADVWGLEIPRGVEVVVYCVHGHEVSQEARARLASIGVRAKFLAGGIEGYRGKGYPTVGKEKGTR
jgi:rhodanese-related sulfurtransferase